MKVSVFSGVVKYFQDVYRGFRSVRNSFLAAFPYVLGMGELRKEVTEQYPDPISSKTPDDLPPRSRGILFNDIERCTGCRECKLVCPSRAIEIETEIRPDTNQVWVSTFNIDLSKCVMCGLCVDACLPNSLVHTRQYIQSAYDLSEFMMRFGKGAITPKQRVNWEIARRIKENEEVLI